MTGRNGSNEARPSRTLRIALLLMNGMWSHDVANVIQVFGDNIILNESPHCSLTLVAHAPAVRLDHGLSAATMPLDKVPSFPDLVCVPGFDDPATTFGGARDAASAAESAACASWLYRAHEEGAVIASLGTGAFLLAEAGLLDNVTCTTHHAYANLFSSLFPQARLARDLILTHDREHNVWTSAGGASGLDLCLSLLSSLAGSREAAAVSEAMSLWRPHPLESRQAAFGMPFTASDALAMSDIDTLCQVIRHDLSHPWTVGEMARRAGMSERSLQRRFLQSTGETPKSWLGTQRIEMASALLEQTDLPLPLIAERVGLSSADVLYRLFRTRTGESPSAHRRRFLST